MIHVIIDDSLEGKWLVELIRNHKSVTVVDEEETKSAKTGAWDNAQAEGASSEETFFDK